VSTRERAATVSLRVTQATKDRLSAAAAAHPYKPSITAIIERGIDLAIAELSASATALNSTSSVRPSK
jgi:hypothetical protein